VCHQFSCCCCYRGVQVGQHIIHQQLVPAVPIPDIVRTTVVCRA
jgi:hypothetical protein